VRPAHVLNEEPAARVSDTWDSTYLRDNGYRYWPSEDLVRSVSARPKASRVLEVGCGNGANLWYLIEHASEVCGLDASPVALAAADRYTRRRLGVEDTGVPIPVQLVQGDVTTRLPYDDGAFDGVVDCMVSQHVRLHQHEALYREFNRVLQPGGWLFIKHLDAGTVCLTEWAGAKWDYDYVELFPDVGLVCMPRPEDLIGRVTAAGFDVKHRRYTTTYPGRPGAVASYTIIDATKRGAGI
jgi:SAM-dependent methyltransferase